MAERYEINDKSWNLIADLFVGPTRIGRPRADDRLMLNGIFWVLCSGAPWREIPDNYGPWSTVYQRYRDWRKQGIFDQVLKRLDVQLNEEGVIDKQVWAAHSSSIQASKPTLRREKHEVIEKSYQLFRQEAIDAKTGQYFGKALIYQPWSFYIVAILAAGIICLIFLFAYFGTYTRKATVTGILTPKYGMLRLNSSTAGLIREVRVKEGQMVHKDEVLFVISGERLSERGNTNRRISEQLDQRHVLLKENHGMVEDRLNMQLSAYDRSLVNISNELKKFSDELELLKKREKLAAANLARQAELAKQGFISISQLQLAEAELLTIKGTHTSLMRARIGLEREQTNLHTQQREAEFRQRQDAAQIAGDITLAKQEQIENDARSEVYVVAPFSGVVTGITAQAGQQLSTGTLLASLIPKGAPLNAELFAATQQAGFIEPGQIVLMRYAAYPYQKFGMARGRVIDVTRFPYAPQELPPHISSIVQGKGSGTDLFYRITVELDSPSIGLYGENRLLSAGILLEADIIQEKRRLYEWTVDPINAITRKLAN